MIHQYDRIIKKNKYQYKREIVEHDGNGEIVETENPENVLENALNFSV